MLRKALSIVLVMHVVCLRLSIEKAHHDRVHVTWGPYAVGLGLWGGYTFATLVYGIYRDRVIKDEVEEGTDAEDDTHGMAFDDAREVLGYALERYECPIAIEKRDALQIKRHVAAAMSSATLPTSVWGRGKSSRRLMTKHRIRPIHGETSC